MNKPGLVRLLKNHEIDFIKWENCVERFSSGKLYARVWYLDLVAEGWNALVYGDYEYVMPLPVKSKFGLKYVSQPAYCQQTGIMPNPPVEIQKLFADSLKKNFRLVGYQLNTENHVLAFQGFKTTQKVNFILPLFDSFENIYQGFSKHTQRNIKTAQKEKVRVIKGLLPSEYLRIKKEATEKHVQKSTYQVLTRLMSNSLTSGSGNIYAAWSSENTLCAAVFMVSDGKRLYYLNAFSTKIGRENRAMYAIVVEIIKEYAGSRIILDFEGSVIEGIARFYKGFGAVAEVYFYIYSNRIPLIRSFMMRYL